MKYMKEKKVIKELGELCNVRLKKLSEDTGQDLAIIMFDYSRLYGKIQYKFLVKENKGGLFGLDAYNVATHSLDVLEWLYKRKHIHRKINCEWYNPVENELMTLTSLFVTCMFARAHRRKEEKYVYEVNGRTYFSEFEIDDYKK